MHFCTIRHQFASSFLGRLQIFFLLLIFPSLTNLLPICLITILRRPRGDIIIALRKIAKVVLIDPPDFIVLIGNEMSLELLS